MQQQFVSVDGLTMPVETFVDCYSFTRLAECDCPPAGWRYTLLLEDGSLKPGVYGEQVYAYRPLAFKLECSGEVPPSALGQCVWCGRWDILNELGDCKACKENDAEHECPRCGCTCGGGDRMPSGCPQLTCRCGKGCAYDWPVIFFREGTFYPIVGPRCEHWANHAALNPGTLRIYDAITGEVLWPEGTEQ